MTNTDLYCQTFKHTRLNRERFENAIQCGILKYYILIYTFSGITYGSYNNVNMKCSLERFNFLLYRPMTRVQSGDFGNLMYCTVEVELIRTRQRARPRQCDLLVRLYNVAHELVNNGFTLPLHAAVLACSAGQSLSWRPSLCTTKRRGLSYVGGSRRTWSQRNDCASVQVESFVCLSSQHVYI